MENMREEELNEALEHDVARKAAAASQVEVHPGADVSVDDVGVLEVKQAYYAKAVSISYVDTAHACARLALFEVQGVSLEGKDLKQKKVADVKRVDMLLSMAERAVKIAKELDVLGDKALVRYAEEPKTEQ